MTIQSSGPISLQDIIDEFGGESNPVLSDYYHGESYVPNTGLNASIPTSGPIKLSNFYSSAKLIAPTAITVGNASYTNSLSPQTTGGSATASVGLVTSFNVQGLVDPTPDDIGDYNYEWTRVGAADPDFTTKSSPQTNTGGGFSRGTGTVSLSPEQYIGGQETWKVRVYNAAGSVTSNNFTISASVYREGPS